MTRNLTALISGTLFGVGLAISGMGNPERARGFLDLFGKWDPTLAFVMGGAMIPMAIAWIVRKRMHRPLACDGFDLPGTKLVDGKLVIGSALFGIGWGIGGLCPGPAVADLAIAPGKAAIFVVAMLAGMGIHRLSVR